MNLFMMSLAFRIYFIRSTFRTNLKDLLLAIPSSKKVCYRAYIGKAIAPDHFWLDYIDHLKSELNPCNNVLYIKDNLTG